jgi:hypothetical protein
MRSFVTCILAQQTIIRMMKSMRTRWEGHVARMMAKRNAYTVFSGKARRKETPLGGLDVGGRIKVDLKRNRMGWYGMD